MVLNISPKIGEFIRKRLLELLGILIILTSFGLFLTLASYSPNDPNFFYNTGLEIKNIFGFYGSVISDFIFQSVGLISFLFNLNLLLWGLKIFFNKSAKDFIPKVFYAIIYILSGSSAISIFKDQSFWLLDNGNGGFIGLKIKEIIFNILDLNQENYIVIILFLITSIFFILSIDLKIITLIKFLKSLKFIFSKLFFLKKVSDNNLSNEELYDAKEKDVKNLNVQPGLPFENKEQRIDKFKNYTLPPLNFLKKNLEINDLKKDENEKSEKNSQFLEKILLDFSVEGKIKRVSHGPVVTLHEFEPAPGIRVSRIINLSEDIARNTSSLSARVSTIPGKNTVGIEIPNSERNSVFLSEIITDNKFNKKEIKLPIALGKSISGAPVVGDLSQMPHLLIAGTTGSGKSICINTIIVSLLYRHHPKNCKLILIDPKMLELSSYEGIPHLLCPVITEARKATSALGWVVKEMENRYKKMTTFGVRNIDGYNSKTKDIMPYIIVIVDEMSDLMLVAGKEIENYIQKLSAMARAAGIHIIMATQRPSVDVITGVIKANFPTRISFQVSSKIDSRTILGEQGAEQLLGKGDMLFMSSANKIVRIHGPYISETEIEKINSFLRSQAEPQYIDEITGYDYKNNPDIVSENDEKKDSLYINAVEIVKSEGKASTSFLQRKLQIGYNRAARIMDMMEKDGIVGQANHVGKREIL